MYGYLIEKLSSYSDTFYSSKKDELQIIFDQLIIDKKIFTATDVNSYYDYYMVNGHTFTSESVDSAYKALNEDDIASLKHFINLYMVYKDSSIESMSDNKTISPKTFDAAINDFLKKLYQYTTTQNYSIDRSNTKRSMKVTKKHKTTQDNSMNTQKNGISTQVIGGFIAVLGVSAVAIATFVLHAAALNVAGLTIACVGGATFITRCGIFAKGCLNDSKSISAEEVKNAKP